LHYNIALVSVEDCRVVRPANVHPSRFGWSKVAAIGHCFESGALMATCGDLVSWSGTLDCQYIVRSTCKITKAGIGGPLVNLDEEVLGMNFCDTRIGTPFLLWTDIDNILSHFREKRYAYTISFFPICIFNCLSYCMSEFFFEMDSCVLVGMNN